MQIHWHALPGCGFSSVVINYGKKWEFPLGAERSPMQHAGSPPLAGLIAPQEKEKSFSPQPQWNSHCSTGWGAEHFLLSLTSLSAPWEELQAQGSQELHGTSRRVQIVFHQPIIDQSLWKRCSCNRNIHRILIQGKYLPYSSVKPMTANNEIQHKLENAFQCMQHCD